MLSRVTEIGRIIMVRINPGDDILLGLRQAVKEHAIRNAVILTGFGSVRHSHFHVVMSNDLPPAESYPKSPQPLDVVAMGGLIIDGRVHAHIDFSDERNGFGGHLEEGCLALTFIVVALADLGDVNVSHWDTFKDEKELR
ncbi:MAG TPA: PPC domain-containing DNA-binding protein [Candidatus Paceibacterota bacterium]|nr:PPC domain-containing DNA-binding protein [Candidatus Paceibacterota bacterium]